MCRDDGNVFGVKAMKHVQCAQCKSSNTELEIDESEIDGEISLHISVWCLDCMTYTPFDIDDDWREYI